MLQVKAALILLESALKPERLKPYWMLWSFPAPDPNLAGAQASFPSTCL